MKPQTPKPCGQWPDKGDVKQKNEVAILYIDLCLESMDFDASSPETWAQRKCALLEVREELEQEAWQDLSNAA
jgi:hypothetical protein